MRIGLSLKPGQGGTKRLLESYGERLLCVRYRYDREKQKRYKTVELIVEEKEWHPQKRAYRANSIVGVKVALREKELQNRIRRAGGKWNHEKQVWELRYDAAVRLALEKRIARQ
ncbi:MAG: hypothetical protein AB1757_30910 [Acidobacteriota bacterium]